MHQNNRTHKYFEDVAETMRLKFRGWEQDLPHHGERGGARERRVADFLKSILPKRYGIGTGHIIDTQGGVSGQIDIVIYDSFDGIHLPLDDYYSLFPCESVYAAIEVKSTLTASDGSSPAGTIYDCVNGATRVKFLNRRINDEFTMIPYIVFAYQTQWNNNYEHVIDWFHKFTNDTQRMLPDMVFILDPESVICTHQDLLRFTHVYSRAPLLFFISELMERLSYVKIRKPNLWSEYLTWKGGEAIMKIYPDTWFLRD